MYKAKSVVNIISGIVLLGCAVYFAVYGLTNPDFTQMRVALNNIPVMVTAIIAAGVFIWTKQW